MPQIDEKKLNEYADAVFNRCNYFNDYTLSTIGRRIKSIGQLNTADQIALKNMADISGDMSAITKKLAEITKMNVSDIENIFTQVVTDGVNSYKPLFDFKGMKFVPFSENEFAQQLVRNWVVQTAGEMINLSRTKALCFDKYNLAGDAIGSTPLAGAFQKAIDDAVIAVSTGTTDFNTAMRETVKRLGGSGVKVTYGSGINRSLSGMVRQNLLYGAKQAAQAYDEHVGEQLGCDGFEVDYHAHPRPSHAFMGGKMYSYNGKVTINGRTYDDGAEALARLSDYGCLHFKIDVILGISEPRYDEKWIAEQKEKDKELIEFNGKQKTAYEWQQAQRRLETETRRHRDIAHMAKASGDKILAKQCEDKIVAYRKTYDDLCDKVGLEKRYNRMATYYPKGIDKAGGNGIINIRGENNLDIKIDRFTPCLENAKTGEIIATSYSLVDHNELSALKGWKFKWNSPSLDNTEIYKLTISGDNEIQGLVALTKYEQDRAVYVNIAESSPNNMGMNKMYNGVGGHLFAIAAQRSIDLGFGGFVFMDAKNIDLVEHYAKTLGATLLGRPHPYRMFIDEDAAEKLLKIYTFEKGE